MLELFCFYHWTIAMIAICLSLLSLVCRSSTQTGLNYFSFFDTNGTQLFFVLWHKRDSIIFRVFRTFLHTNLWYRFVLWYTSTPSVHIHNFCNWSYIFHVQILGTSFTDSTVLQRVRHTLLLTFYRTFWTYAEVVLVYTMVSSYTICYIYEILLENLVLKIWIAPFNEHC